MSKTRILSFVAFYLLLAPLTIAYVCVHFCGSNANNIVSALTAVSLLLATAQSGDRLLLNGKEFFFYTNPLAPFLEQNPQLRPKPGLTMTCNWRGYVATWEVTNFRLLLVEIEVVVKSENPIKINLGWIA